MSDTYQSLSHSRWNGKYHVVFVPQATTKEPVWQHAESSGANLP